MLAFSGLWTITVRTVGALVATSLTGGAQLLEPLSWADGCAVPHDNRQITEKKISFAFRRRNTLIFCASRPRAIRDQAICSHASVMKSFL